MCWYTQALVDEYRETKQKLAPYIQQHERLKAAERKVIEAERMLAVTKATNTLRKYKAGEKPRPVHNQRGLTWDVAESW